MNWNARCWAKAMAKIFDDALVDCNRAVELSPNEATGFDSRALVKWQLGQVPSAQADAEHAVRLDQKDGVYRFRLASILKSQGKTGEADAQFDQARRLAGPGEWERWQQEHSFLDRK